MYRGQPPPKGGYSPPYEGRDPPLPRPYPSSDYRDDRHRPRPSYHADYHDHGPPEPYRRSPPRRRLPSPGTGSHRGGGNWTGGPPRERSSSPCRSGPLDQKLVITVGNELTGSSGSSRLHDRDYHPPPDYERSRSSGRSRGRSPDRSQAKSQGLSKSRARSRSHSPDRRWDKKSGQSRSRTPDRSRAKNRGRSSSHSPDRSRAKSGGRSKSRPRSKSISRSSSRSGGRSYSKAANHGRKKSRQRSQSHSGSTSSGSSSNSNSGSNNENSSRKELEEILSPPTKSILKKRNDSDDSPSLKSSDSPRALEGSNMSRVAEQLLLAVKGMEPHKVASVLSELQSDPRMAESIGLNAEIKEILNLLGGQAEGVKSKEKTSENIDDEEKFLYGEPEEPKPPPMSEPPRHQKLDLYGNMTEETLYEDYLPKKAIISQAYGLSKVASPRPVAPPSKMETDMIYTSRPTITPDLNIRVQVPNPAILAGTEPLEESERQALEEYEKIQDLLKTIGLGLGVSEITKMAERTKERLHGKKPLLKTATRRRRYSSGSSNDSHRSQRRRSHSSSSSSRSHSDGRGSNWSSEDGDRKSSAPSHPGTHIPSNPPSQVHSMMPPNLPPLGYGHYGNYLPYTHQQWPTMYPPPSMTTTYPDQSSVTLTFNKLATDPAVKGHVQVGEKANFSSWDRRISEEQNNENQKQKVLEEREKLKQDREVRMKKKEYLMKELERLRKHQGELLRKKRREKGGHKDPLLQEISHLQEEVMIQISNLRREHEAAEKKCIEIEKVAVVLGLNPSDRPRKASKMEDEPPPPSEKDNLDLERSSKAGQEASTSKMKVQIAAEELTSAEQPFSAQAPPATPPQDPFEYYDAGNHWCKNCNVTCGSMFDFFTHLHSKTHRKTLDPYDRPWASSTKIVKNTESEEKLTKPAKGSEFLLPVRGFFCLLCKEFYGDAICAEEHVEAHAHNEKYKKQMCGNPLYEQKRNLDRQAGLGSDTSGKKRKNEDEEDGNKDKEETSKHKKGKKDKEKNKDENDEKGHNDQEDPSKHKKEKKDKEGHKKQDENNEDFKEAKSLEGERPTYSKKDEDEKYKYSKKDDKQRYRREEEDRGKYSRRDEEDKYKYRKEDDYKYLYRQGEDDRYDNRPIYRSRDDEYKYKYSRYSDFRSKHEKEEYEGKHKAEKEAFKKSESGKPDVSNPQLPPRPCNPPKIFCGPSPQMRAKLRKQSLEESKPSPAATNPSFGKFTWKKKDNVLASEAQKVAAEFIKDDEAAAKGDPFAKSMAYAKEIAEKLGSQPTVPPPWLSKNVSLGKIRPNLPEPAAVLKNTAIMDKPAPLNTLPSIIPQNTSFHVSPPIDGPVFPDPALLNTFQSIAPQNTSLLGPSQSHPPAFPGPQTRAPNVQSAVLGATPVTSIHGPGTSMLAPAVDGSESVKLVAPVFNPAEQFPKPATLEAKFVPTVSNAAPGEAKPVPPVSKPVQVEAKPVPPVSKPVQVEAKPVAPVSTPASVEAKPVASVSTPARVEAKPVPKPASFKVYPTPPVSKPAPVQTKPMASEAKPPQPTVVKIVSDVAAPGVPESEQTQTVFVRPPPFMAMYSGSQKSEKLKTNLAAAKAHDLFHIFYSSVGPSSISITKPVKDHKAKGNNTCQSQPATPQAQKPQPHLQPPTQSQPPGVVCTSAKPDCPSPQTKPQSDIPIPSVWSLQSIPLPEKPQFEITSPTTQPKLNTPVPSEAQSVPEKPSFTHNPQITPQTEPTTLDPTPQVSSLSKPTLQQQPESLPELQPAQEIQHTSIPEAHLDTAPEPEPKSSPKNRGKATKRTSPAPPPVRQTRSHTRYQTRHQQHSHTEPEPDSAVVQSVFAVSDLKGLGTSDPSSGLNPEEGTPKNRDPQIIEITHEALGFPSDFTSLDFESDFNFD